MLQRMSGDSDGVRVVERPDAHDARRRSSLSAGPATRTSCCSRRHLGDEGDRTGLDVRKQCVEKALRAPRVLTGEERFLQLRDDPDDVLACDGIDERLDASLELTDVDGACVDLRRSRLEHDRVVGIRSSAARVSADFPTPCSPTRSTERGGVCSIAATTISTSSRRRPARSAGGSSNGRSQMRPTFCRLRVRTPGLEARSEL